MGSNASQLTSQVFIASFFAQQASQDGRLSSLRLREVQQSTTRETPTIRLWNVTNDSLNASSPASHKQRQKVIPSVTGAHPTMEKQKSFRNPEAMASHKAQSSIDPLKDLLGDVIARLEALEAAVGKGHVAPRSPVQAHKPTLHCTYASKWAS